MPIIVDTIDNPAGGLIADQVVVRPSQGQLDGCELKTASRVVIIAAGHNAVIEWDMRGSAGEALDITSLTVPCGDLTTGRVVLRILDAFDDSLCTLATVDPVTIVDPGTATLRAVLPDSIRLRPSLYILEWTAYDCTGKALWIETGLLSVERSLAASVIQLFSGQGPITLMEIRTQMRDIPFVNPLLNDVEYDDNELIHSIKQPVMYWNEIPPAVAWFTAHDFPFRHHWLKAICANLLRIAAEWYRRNKFLTVAGGVQQGTEKDKDQPYLIAAVELDKEWKLFVERKKIEINASQMYGSV